MKLLKGRMIYIPVIIVFQVFSFLGCDPENNEEPEEITVDIEADSVVFAVIGDFGYSGSGETMVAEKVLSWSPDFIITTGDNNYPEGKLETIEANISDFYGDYIYNFDAPDTLQCHGMAFDLQMNMFFPSPGNHDTYSITGLKDYYTYFTLPGNEEYYRFTWGSAAFYSLNSTAVYTNNQEKWLMDELVASDKLFNIVYFHHPPYSEGPHGDTKKMQWDYFNYGVDVVLTGHDHLYSRIEKKDEPGLYYIVNGAGGKNLYECGENPLDSTEFCSLCFDQGHGAIKGIIKERSLVLEFYSIWDHIPVDRIEIIK